MLAAAALVALTPVEAKRRYGTLEFEPCSLSAEIMPDVIDAQCATLEVPEDRAKPEGRKVKLAIAWLPSRAGSETAADPVLMLAGGPGQAARASYPGVAGAFREVSRKRHIVLVDQRGTGESNALACRDDDGDNAMTEGEDDGEQETPEALRAFAERCLAKLEGDPRFYTTSDAVQDLDAVRQALGAEQLSLVGISYGTRVAQEYLRRYPAHTRAVVLDGVVPATLILGSEHARNLEASLDLQFALCAQDKLCSERFGSARAHLDTLLAELRQAPREVRYSDPLTGELRTEQVGVNQVAGVVRMFAYSPMTAAMLPLALNEAAQGRLELLAQQSRMIASFLGEQFMHGMQLSVMCSEDAPFLIENPADASTTLGNAIVGLTQAQCAVWPKGELPKDFHDPVVSDKPVLLLSGEFDPVTPPRYGEEVLKTLANGRHLVARGQGHNVIVVGCAPKLLGEFFASGDAKKLDASCLDKVKTVAPFAGFYGWEP